MTLNIMMLLILILPIPILVTDLQKGRSPFRAILKGALAAGVGIAFVFAIAQLTGHGIGNEIQQNISRVAGLLADNPQVAKFPQFDDLSRGERAAAIRQAAGNAMNALPASLLVIAAIV